MRNVDKEKVHVVHDNDLEDVLAELGLLSDFKKGNLKCKFCGKVITFDNLCSIYPQAGAVKIICDNNQCTKQLFLAVKKGEVSL